jgi:hypothetical protein
MTLKSRAMKKEFREAIAKLDTFLNSAVDSFPNSASYL